MYWIFLFSAKIQLAGAIGRYSSSARRYT